MHKKVFSKDSTLLVSVKIGSVGRKTLPGKAETIIRIIIETIHAGLLKNWLLYNMYLTIVAK
jgi:hypothetical protein